MTEDILTLSEMDWTEVEHHCLVITSVSKILSSFVPT